MKVLQPHHGPETEKKTIKESQSPGKMQQNPIIKGLLLVENNLFILAVNAKFRPFDCPVVNYTPELLSFRKG